MVMMKESCINMYNIFDITFREMNVNQLAVWFFIYSFFGWAMECIVIRKQLGYSFSLPHIVAYSTIAVQEMNLAYHYPLIYWNAANLIVDAGPCQRTPDRTWLSGREDKGNS